MATTQSVQFTGLDFMQGRFIHGGLMGNNNNLMTVQLYTKASTRVNNKQQYMYTLLVIAQAAAMHAGRQTYTKQSKQHKSDQLPRSPFSLMLLTLHQVLLRFLKSRVQQLRKTSVTFNSVSYKSDHK